MVFLDESGFLLIPNFARTWGPKGQTPFFSRLYKPHRISTISAPAVSPKRRRMVLYLRSLTRNLTGLDIRIFLGHPLLHLCGPLTLLWNRGTIHRRQEIQLFLRNHPWLHVEYFSAYAPELNPAEYVWN